MPRLLCVMMLALAIAACQKKNNFKPLDLSSYGAKVTILAPENPEINTKEGFIKDITVQKDSTYDLQIFVSEKTTDDIKSLLENQLEYVKTNPYFSSIIQQDADGFLYENKLDGASNFGFRLVKISGDQEIILQNALLGTYTREQAEDMYKAARGK